jgi:hypothetical protein
MLIPLILFSNVNAESEKDQEYRVKAAFLYNFIKFIEWPQNKVSDKDTISICVIGENPFKKAFGPIKDKQIGNKKIAIKLYKNLEELKTSDQIDNIRKCHVLFICSSEKKQFKEIFNLIKGHSVLTVSDTEGFLDSGGMINFMIEEQKVCFEINNYSAKQAKLNLRSQLLRLAKKVIEEKSKD